MQKINGLQVNQMYTLPLVVLSVTVRETKAKKSYLSMDFFDGVDTIQANYWDWPGVNIPEKNAVLDVTAQVTEYMGNKQLNVKKLVTNAEIPLKAFMPTGGVSIGEAYKEAYALMSNVRDQFLNQLAMTVLESTMELWLTIPGAKSVHHAFAGGTLVHSLQVAKLSKAIAENTPGANVDLATVGGMLHDLGKLYTYKMDGVTIDMTNNGKLYEHSFMGAEFIGNFAENNRLIHSGRDEAKLRLLRHIILSHHGLLEYGAAVTPQCIEAYIVHYADALDASVQQITEQSRKVGEAMWTDRIYTLNNRPHLTPHYVDAAFLNEEE